MTPVPTCPRVAPCSPPSSTLRAGSADGLRPCLTATAPAAWETSGRDEETARVSRTKKHAWRRAKTNDRGISSSCRQRVNFGCRWTIHFMHPVKSRPAIRTAWAAGVRDFSLDHSDELAKIRQETSGDGELGLFVRLAMPRGRAAYDLSGKFGASVDDAAALLRTARPYAALLGLCFHVGSQCLDPLAGATRWCWRGPRSSGPA